MLVDQSYDVRYLSAAEGLIEDVPKDVSMVVILGPQQKFCPRSTPRSTGTSTAAGGC